MKFSREFLQDLLAKVDLVAVVEEYLPLKRAGREFSACCPFHEERTPSFTVSPQKQFFHCFGCQAHGNVIDFLMKIEHATFIESVQRLCGFAGMALPEVSQETLRLGQSAGRKLQRANEISLPPDPHDQAVLGEIADFYHQILFSTQASHVLNYLIDKRQLSKEILISAKLGYALPGALAKKFATVEEKRLLKRLGFFSETSVDGWSKSGREIFAGRILFPIQDDKGEVVGFGARALGDIKPKYLNSREAPYFKKREILYHWKEALEHRENALGLSLKHSVLLVEGYFDCLSLLSAGYGPCVAGLGTAVSAWQIRKILQRFDALYVCYDADAAGESAQWKLLERALPYLRSGKRLYFVALPPGEDPDSLLRSGSSGKKIFEERVREALPLSDYLFQRLREKSEVISEEGKAAWIRQALPLIKQIPDLDFQEQLLTRLGRYVGVMDPRRLRERLASTAKKHSPKLPSSDASRFFGPPALRRLVALLLQNPSLSLNVEIDLAALKELATEFENVQIFLTLFRQAKRQFQRSLSQRLEVWRSTSYYTLLCQLSVWDHCIDPEHQQEVFTTSLAQLLQQTLERELDKLLMKSKHSGLDLSEKELYLKLLNYLKKNH